MAGTFNSITLLGNVGKDPETFVTAAKKKGARFGLATEDGTGKYQQTNWHNCSTFGKSAEIVAKYVRSGTKVMIQGYLSYNESGGRRFANINVFKIILAGSKNGQGASTEPDLPPQKEGDFPFD